MKASVLAIFALLLADAALNLGLGLLGTLLGLRAGIEGFDVGLIGLIMSANYVGFIFGSLFGPAIVRRVGHIRTFAILASISASATLLHLLFIAPLPWMVFRAITGFGYGGMCLVIESWLNQRASNADRGKILALYMTGQLGASASSQLLINVWPPGGFQLFVLVALIVALSLVPIALTRTSAPPLDHAPRMKLGTLFKASPVGMVGCLATGVIYSSGGGLAAVFAQAHGMTTFEISIFMTLIVAGGTVALWPIGRASDRFDRRHVVAGLCVALVICAGAIWLAASAGSDPVPLYILGTLYGAASLPIYGIAVAHANDKLASDQYVAASSTLLLCYGIGAAIGPTLAARVMDMMGANGLFAFVAAVSAATGLFVLWRIATSPAVADEAKSAFVPVAEVAPAAPSLARADLDGKAA